MWKIAAFSRQYDRSPVPPHNVYLKQTAVLKLQDGGRPPSWKSKNFIFFFIGQVAWIKRDDEEWKKNWKSVKNRQSYSHEFGRVFFSFVDAVYNSNVSLNLLYYDSPNFSRKSWNSQTRNLRWRRGREKKVDGCEVCFYDRSKRRIYYNPRKRSPGRRPLSVAVSRWVGGGAQAHPNRV